MKKNSFRIISAVVVVAMLLTLVVGLIACGESEFKYKHDPRDNPSAMADIVADENAVYGFRPSETGSLKAYATSEYDWTDPAFVEENRQARIAYHKSLESMYKIFDAMLSSGSSIEEIARVLSATRNQLRLAACKDEQELAETKAYNLSKYGHEEGPLPDELYEKYGSWGKVLEKAFSTNSGMDACLGLYDDYYYLYVASGQIPADKK